MDDYLTLFSPAKINFFFKVLHQREDGYHEIVSLYQAITLGDLFQIKLSDQNKFKSEGFLLKFDDSNLIYKAIEAYKRKVDRSFWVDISLKKNIPIGAGLGGGSSNAATALFGVNELLNRPLTDTQLIDIGKEIGTDVSFFFSSGSALCTGRGELFENISLKNTSLYLALPPFGISTPSVYKKLDLNILQSHDEKEVLQLFQKGEYRDLFNDLESSAFAINPRLQSIKKSLQEMGFKKVVMTGSGSSFLCFGDHQTLESGYFLRQGDISFYKIENIQRNSNSWYPLLLN